MSARTRSFAAPAHGRTHRSAPTRGRGRFPQPPGPAAHSVASAPAGARKWVGITAEIIPKVPINTGQSLSHGYAVPAPFTQGGLGTGDTDCRVASLLAMTVLIIPRRPNGPTWESVLLRWTGDGPPYLGHGLRRPNFGTKFGASVRSSAPTESPINHPSQPARSEASAPAAARDGRESAQRPSKRGNPPRPPKQRLAKQKARKEELVKFGLCPMTELCSTAYWVRKSDGYSARAPVGAALIGQNSLEPRPAAREGALRP